MATISEYSRAEQTQRSLRYACLCAKTVDEYRGKEIVVLDLTETTPIFDYFVVATGTSRRQMMAMADEVSRQLKAAGSKCLSTEGQESGSWILQDYGDVVLHLFTDEARDQYDLEHLWAMARRVDWKAALAELS